MGSIDLFKKQVADYFNRINYSWDKPIYKIGDKVKTRPDKSESYITKVIGSGKEGIVLTECCIPLIDFGKGREYYVYQDKLKAV